MNHPPRCPVTISARASLAGVISRGESGVGAAEGRETERRFSGNWGEVMTATKEKREKCWEL